MDDQYCKGFIEYLIFIGIINQTSIHSFLANYNTSIDKMTKNTNDVNGVIIEALTGFLTNMNKVHMKTMVKNILMKYSDNQMKMKQRELVDICNCIHRILLKRSFGKMKKSIFSNGKKASVLYSNCIAGRKVEMNNQQRLLDLNDNKRTLSPKPNCPNVVMIGMGRKRDTKLMLDISNRGNANKGVYGKYTDSTMNQKTKKKMPNSQSFTQRKTFEKLYRNAKDIDSNKNNSKDKGNEAKSRIINSALINKKSIDNNNSSKQSKAYHNTSRPKSKHKGAIFNT